MGLLIDRFPTEREPDVSIDIPFTGRPTIGSALVRLLTSIPSGLVLGFLWFGSSILWVVAAVLILVGAPMPEWILAYQRGVLRWETRLVAYHASLVDEYPPFAFDTEAQTVLAVRLQC
jgi:hypothetical protein